MRSINVRSVFEIVCQLWPAKLLAITSAQSESLNILPSSWIKDGIELDDRFGEWVAETNGRIGLAGLREGAFDGEGICFTMGRASPLS